MPAPKVAGPSDIGNYLASLGIPTTAGFGVAYRNLYGTDECIQVTCCLLELAVHLSLNGSPRFWSAPGTGPPRCSD
jgi:hypothetical protein